MKDLFTDSESLRTIDTRRIIYLLIAVVFFVLTELGRNVYRPYIYSNNIDDFGLADSIGNLGGIVVQIFFSLAILNSPLTKAWRVIGFIVIGYIIYEAAQPYLPRGTFDWRDIYGTVTGGAISAVILLIINSTIKNRVLHKL